MHLVRHALSSSPVLSLALAAVAHGQACNELTNLRGFGGTQSRAVAVSGDGNTIVGFADTNIISASYDGFRWTHAFGMQRLSNLLGVPNTAFAFLDVDYDGDTFLYYKSTSASGLEHEVWRPGLGTTSLGTMIGIALSGDGSTVVGHAPHGVGNATTPLLWTAAGGAQVLPFWSGNDARPFAVSFDGTVAAGMATDANGQFHAVQWIAGGPPTLVPTPPAQFSIAVALSADGQVVIGQYDPPNGPTRGFRWSAGGGAQDLGEINGVPLLPTAVSADGSIVVGRAGLYAFRVEVSSGAPPIDLGSFGGAYTYVYDISADGTIVVGSSNLANSLAVRAYRWNGAGGIGQSFCDPAIPNSTGCSGYISASGSRAVADNDLRLRANRLPQNATSFFLASRTQTSAFPVPNSAGALCLGGSIGRYVGPGQIRNSGIYGVIELSVDLHAIPQPNQSVTAQPGETWHFQAWHRDVDLAGAPTSNFTDGVSLLLQ